LTNTTEIHAKIRPGIENWISAGAGKTGLSYGYVLRMNNAQVELYIDRGDGTWNKRVFDTLYRQKEAIENIFGAPLDWQRLDDKRGCRVRYLLDGYGLQDKEHWPELQDSLIDAMIRLEKAFHNYIRQL
jgi:hypothetical protein